MSWPCPECGAECGVIDSRQFADGRRRRRACPACGGRFTTMEVPLKPGQRAVDFLEMGAQLQAKVRNEVMLDLVDYLRSKGVVEDADEPQTEVSVGSEPDATAK